MTEKGRAIRADYRVELRRARSGGSGRRSSRARRSSASSARSCSPSTWRPPPRAPGSASRCARRRGAGRGSAAVMLRRAARRQARRGAGGAGRPGGGGVSRREQVFWGWGEPGAGPSLPDHAAAFLRSELGVEGAVVSRPVALEDVRLREPALAPATRERLAGIVGEAGVRDDPPRRVGRCRASPTSTCCASARATARTRPTPWSRRRPPPRSRRCSTPAARRAAVVPFGGGTSVVGGLEPLRGRYEARSSLDLGRLDGVESRSTSAHTLGAGCAPARGCRRPTMRSASAASRSATRRRATSGRRSAAAWRRARPASPRPGTGGSTRTWWRCAARRRRGGLETLAVPSTAAGPSLEQLVIGSEGVLGAITGVGLRVLPVAEARRYEGWAVRSFEAAARRCERSRRPGSPPTWPGSPTRPRPGCRSRWPDAARRRARLARRCGAAACWCAGGRARRSRWGCAAGCRRAPCAARAPGRSGRAPARRGPRHALRGPASARRPARSRRDGRDARDGDHVVEPRGAAVGGHAGARGRAGGRRSCSATPRTSTRPGPRSTSPSSPPAADRGDPAGQWRRAKAAAMDADRRGGRHDHPPPRGGRRSRAVAARLRPARSATTSCACSRRCQIPRGS